MLFLSTYLRVRPPIITVSCLIWVHSEARNTSCKFQAPPLRCWGRSHYTNRQIYDFHLQLNQIVLHSIVCVCARYVQCIYALFSPRTNRLCRLRWSCRPAPSRSGSDRASASPFPTPSTRSFRRHPCRRGGTLPWILRNHIAIAATYNTEYLLTNVTVRNYECVYQRSGLRLSRDSSLKSEIRKYIYINMIVH